MPGSNRPVAVMNCRNGAVLADRCAVARSSWRRLVGLIGRSALAPGEGLWLAPCNAIHSVFMRFSFDAVFLDREQRVVHLVRAMAPYRFSRIVPRAHSVLELPAGTIDRTETRPGDALALVERPLVRQ